MLCSGRTRLSNRSEIGPTVVQFCQQLSHPDDCKSRINNWRCLWAGNFLWDLKFGRTVRCLGDSEAPSVHLPQVFEHTAQNIIDSVLDGYNGTIFACGQTGADTIFPDRKSVV